MMPIVAIRTDVRDRMIELARKRQASEEKEKSKGRSSFHSIYDMAFEDGFMSALAFFLPSESVGFMIADRDNALEGKPMLTERLPGLMEKGE